MKKRIVGTILAALLGMALCAGCAQGDATSRMDEPGIESGQAADGSADSGSEQDAGNSTESGSEQDAEDSADKGSVEMAEYDEEQIRDGYIDYSIELLKESVTDGTNSMISPLSVMMAMDMAAAGAKGSTQDQITQMFCPGASQAQIESYLNDLLERYQANEDVELHIANSIWINDGFAEEINTEYLDRANQVFDATARVLPFDAAAVDEINGWVDENTNGMIDRLLNSLQPDTVLCLLNATAVEAPWAKPYEDAQVWEDEFTDATGQTQSVEMMHGTEEDYFETEDAVGFLKYYEGGEYGFLAILPKEGMTVEEYLAGMTGERYREFYDTRTGAYKVHTMMPKFTYEYELTMNDVLYALGVKDAFDGSLADFSGIASPVTGNLYIDLVMHKTFIEVGQYETRAAAVTGVMMTNLAMPIEEEYREVYLNRPFIYAIIDMENGTPIFIGTLQSVQ
ncbi:MAG: serpin family protein [Lachnospiraceae bacterium]|nr:serpin family protein [Lachnospiraceae bacterium]